MIVCPLCAGGNSYATVSVFLTHLRMFHANEANFQIQCGLQGCKRTFRNFYTYRNHVYSMHDVNSTSTNQLIVEQDEVSSDSASDHNHVQESPVDLLDLPTTTIECKLFKMK